jgi:hypothetical protein
MTYRVFRAYFDAERWANRVAGDLHESWSVVEAFGFEYPFGVLPTAAALEYAATHDAKVQWTADYRPASA